ncbi:MAGE domain-containing protein [Chloropicon roscoffensis]|uniref:MAGE domain-containing protein n=2 Tax=Chloropicon roscoffensis TaxID=1461544 RepID=A0AAX4P5C3_9CHLO
MAPAKGKGKKRVRAQAAVEVVDLDDNDDGLDSVKEGSGELNREREAKEYAMHIKGICEEANAAIAAARGADLVSEEELEKLVGDVMRYILFNIGKQNSQPIAREKVTALVTKKYPRKTGLSQTVLQKARHRFAHIWGMDLRELVKTTAAGEATTQRYYILRSALPKRFRDGIRGPERDGVENKEEKGLLLAVLMMLSLSGDEMTEERLWEHLSLLGLDKGTKHHVFGDPGSVLAKFVRQRYLVKVPKKSDSGRIFLYQPGENAQDEIDAFKMNEAISKVLQKGTNVQEVIELD